MACPLGQAKMSELACEQEFPNLSSGTKTGQYRKHSISGPSGGRP